MNDKLVKFLDSIDTKTNTTFKKEANTEGVEGVSTISVDNEGQIATVGWCAVDSFPDEIFVMQPAELKWLLSLGRQLSIKDNMLLAQNEDISQTFWRLETAQFKTVQITYDESPFIMPDRAVSLLTQALIASPKDFVFEVKDKILTIRIEYQTQDKATKTGEHTTIRLPADLPDQRVVFDGSVATVLQLMKGDTQFLFGGKEKPSQITITGDGYVVHHYIAPISDYEEDNNDME